MEAHNKNHRIHPNFNRKRNLQKATFSLLGLCKGLVADHAITPREVLFLNSWLQNQPHLADDPDARDILCCVSSILEDGRIDQDELDDLYQLIQDTLQYRAADAADADAINQLLGLLTGISADSYINLQETQYLRQWLAENAHLRNTFPASMVHDKIDEILADGIVTDEERTELLTMLRGIVGNQFETTGIACGLSTEFCTQQIESLDHTGRTFCITGTLSSGPRNHAIELITERGGLFHPRITKKLDVLIIGTIASPDWRFTSHGRKIEYAIELQTKGQNLLIINERTWRKFL